MGGYKLDNFMRENEDVLKKWIEKVHLQVETVKSQFIGSNEFKLIYMIGNTSTNDPNSQPYITPMRKISNAYIIGSIVFTQAQAVVLSALLDGKVDYIFLDAEKKLPTIKNADYNPYKIFNLEHLIPKTDNQIEYGNISAACSKIITKSIVQEYKANDLTVDATWNFLTSNSTDLSGKKIVIIGAGNIGLKLSLKLVECGAEVIIVTKENQYIQKVIDSLNSIKNKGAISEISKANLNDLHKFKATDIIIGCTNSTPVISSDIVSQMNNNGLVVDLGKGTITDDGINRCSEKNIRTWRVDIAPMLDSVVSASLAMSHLLNSVYGKKCLDNGVKIISGGFIGNRYDVVVDNYKSPKAIIGVCSSPGKFMEELDTTAKEIVSSVETYIKNIN